jgi:CTP synthase
MNLKDAYKSLDEALTHGGIFNNLKVNLTRIDSEKLKPKDLNILLKNVSGVLIPGGFGKRGSEGKIAAIKYARLNNIPFFGICFGMQMAIIEAARNMLNIKNASTSEFGNNCTPVVGLLEEWQKGKKVFKGSKENLGGTMRLGLYDAVLKKNSLISKIYSAKRIKERHRHRYEVNIKYVKDFEKKGLIFSALSPDGTLPEIIELKNHPWFIGVQFHPEFKSRPFTPHPLFSSFIKAAFKEKGKN